ncbi:kelch-like protein 12 [Ixodes scapularis]|uniref:kelch-like protein 12 n=1 Tax=Ixodes scapularis TaxID=6945 RepID=UPI001AD7BA5A|nr:kelch-like protein 12 [Ixodes scapularis]
MPQAKSYHASVAVEDSVYIIGGYTLESTFDAEPLASASCFRLDVLAMSWETVAPLNRARACHVAVAALGRIYVAGGKDKKGRITDSVESYDVSTGRWEQLPNLPRPLMASAAAHFQGSFWVLGGVTRSKNTDCRVTDAVYQFDFTDVTEKYCFAPPSSTGNQVSIFGGIDTERGVATDAHTQLNVSDQTIRAARPLPCPLAGASALAFSGYRRSPSLKSLRSEAESDDDEPKLKLRTVYRRYRQRRKLRDQESDLDPRFPKAGVFESTRILDSTFDHAKIRRQDISREKSPDFGTKEERLSVELRNHGRQLRKELVSSRELKCAQGVVRSDSYQILAPAVDPNLGLALVLQDEEKTYRWVQFTKYTSAALTPLRLSKIYVKKKKKKLARTNF